MSAFLQSDSHPVNFITWEMLRFPHQFAIALENAKKSIKLREPGKLMFILYPKYGYFFPSDSHPMVSPTPRKLHGFFQQFPTPLIPDTLELKAGYIKRRRRHGCNFIKKEKKKKKDYKYTSGKSMPPYTKPSLLLTIKQGSYLFICILNLEFHFKKVYHLVNSKNTKNIFQSNKQRFLATI